MGSFAIVNKLVLELDNNEKAWIFHGDVFDVTMRHSKWLAKLGAMGYDGLILFNRLVNYVSEKILDRGKISLSGKIKNSVKKAVSYINHFEFTAAEIGILNHYDYVVCGHIHQPQVKEINTAKGSIVYLNSGDWIENLSALEYHQGQWKIFYYKDSGIPSTQQEEELTSKQLFANMVREFDALKSHVITL